MIMKIVVIGGIAFTLVSLMAETVWNLGDAVFVAAPVTMELAHLSYDAETGLISQHIKVSGRKIIHGFYAAEIVRDGVHLCGGDGGAPYDGHPVKMTVDDWVNDECPDLQQGDKARVTWSWPANDGTLRGIFRELTIPAND